MKLIEIINRVKKENPTYICHEWFCNEVLNIDWYYDVEEIDNDIKLFDSIFKSYHLFRYCDTDTWCGVRVYFCNDTPFAISSLIGRKNHENIEFISQESIDYAIKVFKENFTIKKSYAFADLDEDLDDSVTLNYLSEIIDTQAFYNGYEVEVLRSESRKLAQNDGCCDILALIKIVETDEIKVVEIKDLQFPLLID